MLRVLGIPASSNVQKVMWLCAELGLPCTREDFGGKGGQSIKAPPYTDWNPNGTVPTLIDGDFVLWESNSICRYLARKVPSTPLYPEGLAERALCERWMDWQLGTLRPSFHPYFRLLIGPDRQQDAAGLAAMHATASRAFDIMEMTLEKSGYLGGAAMTLAEITTASWVHRWFKLGLDAGRTPRLKACYERLRLRPAFVEHLVSVPFE